MKARLIAILAWLSVAALFGAPAGADTPSHPRAAAYLRTMVAEGLLTNFFDAEIGEIANHYVSGTRFAGRVAVNLPFRSGYLNIYVFRSAGGLGAARSLADMCTTFARDAIVMCDRRLLDSIPASLPVIVEGHDRPPAPGLMYWVLGHEIGHAVLGTEYTGEAAAAGGDPVITFSSATSNDTVRSLNAMEIDADRFAIAGLPVRTAQDWVYFGNPIIDALNWYIREYRIPRELERPQVAPAPFRVDLNVATGVHPPMPLRLYSLVAMIRRTFAQFPFGDGFIPPIAFHLHKVDMLPQGAAERGSTLFYGNVYLGSDFAARDAPLAQLDLAAIATAVIPGDDAAALQASACNGFLPISPVEKLQASIACGRALPLDLATLITGCPRAGGEGLRCYALLPAAARLCSAHDPRTSGWTCPPIDVFKSAFTGYADAQFEHSMTQDGILAWMRLENYRFIRDVLAAPADRLDEWVLQNAKATVAEPHGDTEAMIEAHLAYLNGRHAADFSRLANFYGAAARIEVDAGNEDGAIKHYRALLAMMATAPELAAAQGYFGIELARVLRSYRVWAVGSSQAIGASVYNRGMPSAVTTADDAVRAQSAPAAVAAAAAYDRAQRAAAAAGRRREADQFWLSRITALGEAIYSWNVTLDLKAGLAAARTLSAVLDRGSPLFADAQTQINVLAPAYENCAVALLTAPGGDAARALAYMQRVIQIRTAAKIADQTESRRLLAYAQYATGKRAAARRTMADMVRDFASTYNRRFPTNTGMPVAGKYVSVDTVLAAAEIDRASP